MKSTSPLLGLGLLFMAACGEQSAQTAAVVSPEVVEDDTDELRLITWAELLPDGEEEVLAKIYDDFYAELDQRLYSQPATLLSEAGTIQEGSPLDQMPQLGTFNTVDELNGQLVEIPGFIVPLDLTAGSMSAFLIVPYFGACIHTPPPAPNQIVYAVAEPAQDLDSLYLPRWFKGRMETNPQYTEMGDAAYTLHLESVRLYQ